MKQSRGGVCRAILAGACLLSLSSGAEAAESIRVLLSADVPRLDIRADGPLWVTDAKGRGQALRAPVQVTAVGAGFLLNGVRMQTEQLTLQWRRARPHIDVSTTRSEAQRGGGVIGRLRHGDLCKRSRPSRTKRQRVSGHQSGGC